MSNAKCRRLGVKPGVLLHGDDVIVGCATVKPIRDEWAEAELGTRRCDSYIPRREGERRNDPGFVLPVAPTDAKGASRKCVFHIGDALDYAREEDGGVDLAMPPLSSNNSEPISSKAR